MDRQSFLDELRSHLQVLQDEEQEDILDEYLQHIEMKIKDGLKEEEAIKDFGPVGELAAEILEAYHVKPDLGQGQERGRERSGKSGWQSGAHGLGRSGPSGLGRSGSADRRWAGPGDLAAEGIEGGTAVKAFGQYIKKAAFGILRAVKRTGQLTMRCGRCIFRAVCSPFRRMGPYMAMGLRQGEAGIETVDPSGSLPDAFVGRGSGSWAGRAPGRRPGGLARQAGRGTVRSVRRLAGWMVDLSLWCCRVVWNGGILLLTMSFACAGLCFLFSLGVLTVLLCQGYPFTGLAIGCLGAVLCCTALTVSCCTFFAERAVRGTVRDAGGGAVRGAKGNARGGAVRRAEGNASGAAKGAEGSVRGIEGKGAPEDHGQEG